MSFSCTHKVGKPSEELVCLSDRTAKFSIDKLETHDCGLEKYGNLEARVVSLIRIFKSRKEAKWVGYWEHDEDLENVEELELRASTQTSDLQRQI